MQEQLKILNWFEKDSRDWALQYKVRKQGKGDPAWENTAYEHTKFDNYFRLWILITFCLSTVYQWNFR